MFHKADVDEVGIVPREGAVGTLRPCSGKIWRVEDERSERGARMCVKGDRVGDTIQMWPGAAVLHSTGFWWDGKV